MKKRLIFLIPLFLLACRALFPDQMIAPASSISTQALMVVPTLEMEATAFAPNSEFTLMRIYPKNGDLQTQLAAEAEKATALGQLPFVEFDATWCPPCKAMTASLAAKDPLMMNAYRGIYLIHVDVDEWGWSHPEAGLVTDVIPTFFALDPEGKATGTKIDGGAWEEDIPENIAPVLTKFFHP